MLLPGLVAAQTSVPPVESANGTTVQTPTETLPGLPTLRERLEAVEKREDLTAEERSVLSEQLGLAVDSLTRAQTVTDDVDRLVRELNAAPARIEEIAEALERSRQTPSATELARGLDLPTIEARLRSAEAELASLRQRQQRFADALKAQRQRPDRLQSLLAEARDLLARVDPVVDDDLQTPERSELESARQNALRAQQVLGRAEVAAWEKELTLHDQRVALLSAEQDLAQRDVAAQEAIVGAWQAAEQRERRRAVSETAREVQLTEQLLAHMPSGIREQAERNTQLAETLKTLTAREATATADLARAERRVEEVGEDLALLEQRVQLAGLNETLALVVRQSGDALPTASEYGRETRRVQDETRWATGIQIDSEQARRDLLDPRAEAQRIVGAMGPNPPQSIRDALVPSVEAVLRQQKELAENLHAASGRYIKQLGRLDNANRTLLARAEAFRRFIDEHLLWIRSAPPLGAGALAEWPGAVRQFLAPERWHALLGESVTSMRDTPARWVLGLAGLALVALFRRRARAVLVESARHVGRARRDSIRHTLNALASSVWLALPWPVLLLALALPLRIAESELARAVGQGLQGVAGILFAAALLGALTRANGVGTAHFGWPDDAGRWLRAQLRWFVPVYAALGFMVWTVEALGDPALQAPIGRPAFVVMMLALLAFVSVTFHPGRPLIQALVVNRAGAFLTRVRYLAYAAGLLAPLVLIGLTLLGYHYSAVALQGRLQTTAWLIIGLVVASETLGRLVYVELRRMAWIKARDERLAALRERQAEAEGVEEHAEDSDAVEPAEPIITPEEVETQAGSVVRTVVGAASVIGIWVVWADVLPALSVLNEITLWETVETVDGIERSAPVSIVHVALAGLIGFMASVATRNLPGALELGVLNRTSMDAGARYAFTTLCRYVIAGAGIVAVFNLLGMQWSQLQWLVAALSVGLGFGLQEIVANFVSGIILLFERPIRVGDIISVNGKDGVVSRIQIRATTLTDFTRKEIIVPNKQFITDEVINWSLSNGTIRVSIGVGLAYGEDTDKARELLLSVARENPRVLDDPAPIASFHGFGDSALNLTLMCFLPNMDGYHDMLTELHSGIDRKFREAGLTIAFPQRDVHLHAGSPIDVRVVPNGGAPIG